MNGGDKPLDEAFFFYGEEADGPPIPHARSVCSPSRTSWLTSSWPLASRLAYIWQCDHDANAAIGQSDYLNLSVPFLPRRWADRLSRRPLWKVAPRLHARRARRQRLRLRRLGDLRLERQDVGADRRLPVVPGELQPDDRRPRHRPNVNASLKARLIPSTSPLAAHRTRRSPDAEQLARLQSIGSSRSREHRRARSTPTTHRAGDDTTPIIRARRDGAAQIGRFLHRIRGRPRIATASSAEINGLGGPPTLPAFAVRRHQAEALAGQRVAVRRRWSNFAEERGVGPTAPSCRRRSVGRRLAELPHSSSPGSIAACGTADKRSRDRRRVGDRRLRSLGRPPSRAPRPFRTCLNYRFLSGTGWIGRVDVDRPPRTSKPPTCSGSC